MTSYHALDSSPIRRTLWIAVVDAVLPVVPTFWAVVDFGSSVADRFGRYRAAERHAHLHATRALIDPGHTAA